MNIKSDCVEILECQNTRH